MKYKELAAKYKLLMSNGDEESAVALILIEFGRRVMDLQDPSNISSIDRSYKLVNKRANNFIDKYKLDIPRNFVLTYLKDKGIKYN